MSCRTGLAAIIAVLLAPTVSLAVPPLLIGDVPTADEGHYEWFLGMRVQKSGAVGRQLPFTELVYGISDRQEITFEVPYNSQEGHVGGGDAVVGTKLLLQKEAGGLPGVACSFEYQFPTGSTKFGMGSGTRQFDIRGRLEKTWKRFTGIANTGYTFVSDADMDDHWESRRDVRFVGLGQMYALSRRTKLLADIYWRSNAEPGGPHRFAADIGLKRKLRQKLTAHAAFGKSLRDGNEGGPDYRVYAGVKMDF